MQTQEPVRLELKVKHRKRRDTEGEIKTTAVVQASMRAEDKDELETFGWACVVGRWEESPSLGSFVLCNHEVIWCPPLRQAVRECGGFREKDGEFLGLS